MALGKRVRLPRLPLFLVAISIALLLYAYFVDRKSASDLDRAAHPGALLPGLHAAEVGRVELQHGDESTVLVRGGDGAWAMTSPRREPADSAAVDNLLRTLELAKALRSVSSTQDIGAVRARARLAAGRTELALDLGSDAPAPTGAAYVRIEGGATVVVPAALATVALRGADAYRMRALIPYGADEIERIEWTVGGDATPVVLVRSAEAFRVGGPGGLRAGRAFGERATLALEGARVEHFLDHGAAETSGVGARTAMRIVVTPRAGRPPVELTVDGDCPAEPGRVVTGRAGAVHVVGCVARGAFDVFEPPVNEIVDHALLTAHADEVAEVLLEAEGKPKVDLARRAGGWHERAPEDRQLDTDQTAAVNALVSAMTGAVGLEPAPGTHDVLVAARATITRTGREAPEVLELGPPDAGGTTTLVRKDDGAVLQVARSVARLFEPHPVVLQARPVWGSSLRAESIVAVRDTCAPRPERFERHGDAWRAVDPVTPTADPALIRDMVDTLVRAKADRWVAETDDGTFGFDAQGCSVALTLEGAPNGAGTVSPEIVFGAAAEGGFYARTSQAKGIFLAPAALRAAASHPPLSGDSLRLEPAPGVRVVVASPDGRQAVVEGTATGFVRVGAAADAGTDRFTQSLAAFVARDAIHVGPPSPQEHFEHPTLELRVVTSGRARTIRIGSLGHDGPADIYYARVSGIDATFAVPRRTVDAILETWAIP